MFWWNKHLIGHENSMFEFVSCRPLPVRESREDVE